MSIFKDTEYVEAIEEFDQARLRGAPPDQVPPKSTTAFYLSNQAKKKLDTPVSTEQPQSDWVFAERTPDFTVYRKLNPASGLYAYSGIGILPGVSPKTCYDVLLDLEYRQEWDQFRREARVHGTGLQPSRSSSSIASATRSDGIRWRARLPWPMKSREYVYWREGREIAPGELNPYELTDEEFLEMLNTDLRDQNDQHSQTPETAENTTTVGEDVLPKVPSSAPPAANLQEKNMIYVILARSKLPDSSSCNTLDDGNEGVPASPVSQFSDNSAYDDKSLDKNFIRVTDYEQTIVLQNSASFRGEGTLQNDSDEDSTIIYMKYYDDPKGNIPTSLINYYLKTHLPKWLAAMVSACRKYGQKDDHAGVKELRDVLSGGIDDAFKGVF